MKGRVILEEGVEDVVWGWNLDMGLILGRAKSGDEGLPIGRGGSV